MRRSRRALWFVVLGAIGGHLVAATWLGGQAIFPPIQGSRWSVLRLGLVVLVPAALTARLLLAMRTHITVRPIIRRTGLPPWVVIAVMSVIAGGCVAIYPFAAGQRHGRPPRRVGLVDGRPRARPVGRQVDRHHVRPRRGRAGRRPDTDDHGVGGIRIADAAGRRRTGPRRRPSVERHGRGDGGRVHRRSPLADRGDLPDPRTRRRLPARPRRSR